MSKRAALGTCSVPINRSKMLACSVVSNYRGGRNVGKRVDRLPPMKNSQDHSTNISANKYASAQSEVESYGDMSNGASYGDASNYSIPTQSVSYNQEPTTFSHWDQPSVDISSMNEVMSGLWSMPQPMKSSRTFTPNVVEQPNPVEYTQFSSSPSSTFSMNPSVLSNEQYRKMSSYNNYMPPVERQPNCQISEAVNVRPSVAQNNMPLNQLKQHYALNSQPFEFQQPAVQHVEPVNEVPNNNCFSHLASLQDLQADGKSFYHSLQPSRWPQTLNVGKLYSNQDPSSYNNVAVPALQAPIEDTTCKPIERYSHYSSYPTGVASYTPKPRGVVFENEYPFMNSTEAQHLEMKIEKSQPINWDSNMGYTRDNGGGEMRSCLTGDCPWEPIAMECLSGNCRWASKPAVDG